MWHEKERLTPNDEAHETNLRCVEGHSLVAGFYMQPRVCVWRHRKNGLKRLGVTRDAFD